MADRSHPPATPLAPAREAYSQAGNPAFDAELTVRTAAREAAFLLPHLRPGMCLLDIGCGPGTITLGLAEAVAPGEVVGLDLRPEVVEQARTAAAKRGITNVRFEAGSAYELPFPDASFDAAFTHVVLMHLREPTRALAEVRRVLRPGGMVGVRDPDFGARLVYPLTPLWEQYDALRGRVQRHNGGDPCLARTHRRLLLDAGLARSEAGTSANSSGSLAETRRIAAFLKAQLRGIAPTVVAEDWAEQATLDAMVLEFDAWAERLDAFYAAVYCHAIGWLDA